MKTWFTIRNSAADPSVGEISIHNEIGFWGINADTFIRDLRGLGPVQTIRLSINSPGGDVFDGWAIYNALKMHPAKVEATVMGVAASMASVIAMAADTITMPLGAMMMIHNPVGVAVGEARDMQHMAALLDQIKQDIVAAYANRTGMSTDEIATLMDAETWMNGQQALDQGFCDVCDVNLAAAAIAFDNARLVNMPRASATTDPVEAPVEPTAPAAETPAPGTPAAPVEPTAPAATDAPPTATTGSDTPPAPEPATATAATGSLVQRAIAFLRGQTINDSAQVTDLRAQLQSLATERDTLNAQLATLTAELATLRPKAEAHDALEAALADKRNLLAEVAAQHGLSAEETASLPTPKADAGSIIARFNAITDSAERSKFYKEHKDELRAARLG